MIQTWTMLHAHLPKGYTFAPIVFKIWIGSLVVFWLSLKLSGFYAGKMRYSWDRAMVSNLAKNVGGGYEQGTRDRIATIIVGTQPRK
jgi:hypothetical protein